MIKWKEEIIEAIDFSKYLRDECAKYALPYFDTSKDFAGQIEAARSYLLGVKLFTPPEITPPLASV